jgi:transcriptional regulator with GAF, ATPase, and Fis domain
VSAKNPGIFRDRSIVERAGWTAPEQIVPRLQSPLMKTPLPPITLEDYNLEAAERRLCIEALARAGNIVGAAQILGITRHALKRRIVKLDIPWTRGDGESGPSK